MENISAGRPTPSHGFWSATSSSNLMPQSDPVWLCELLLHFGCEIPKTEDPDIRGIVPQRECIASMMELLGRTKI